MTKTTLVVGYETRQVSSQETYLTRTGLRVANAVKGVETRSAAKRLWPTSN